MLFIIVISNSLRYLRQFDRYDFYDKDFFNALWNLQTEFLSLSKNVRRIAYFHHGASASLRIEKCDVFHFVCTECKSIRSHPNEILDQGIIRASLAHFLFSGFLVIKPLQKKLYL